MPGDSIDSDQRPYVTFLLTARNDGHAGNFLHRLKVCVDANTALFNKYGLPAEILIIEWNPVEGKERLIDAVEWPEDPGNVSIRIIEVPREIHERYPNSDEMPIYQFTAKNAGIRRAAGEYIISTNADIVLSEELVQFLADRRLSSGKFYRADRHDVGKTVPLDLSPEEQLDFCWKNLVRLNTIKGKLPADRIGCAKTVAGRFLRRPLSFFTERRPWPGRCMYLLVKAALTRTPTPEELAHPKKIEHLYRTASGDFLLMSKKDWLDIKGFPELTTQWHGDSYVCIKSAGAGLEQTLLKPPMVAYHQEHDRSVHYDRPSTDAETMLEIGRRVLSKSPTNQMPSDIQNDESWGLKDEELEVYIVS